MSKAISNSQRGEAATLDQQIKEVDEQLKVFDRAIAENAAGLSTAETRLRMAKEELPRLIARKEEARTERGKAVASGNGQASAENLAALSERIKSYGQEIELTEDEISGLTASIEQLVSAGTNAKRERLALSRQIPMAKLRDAARRYNALAEQLGPVLEELWRLRAELGEPLTGRVVQSPSGFLSSLPRAFVTGDPEFLDAGDPDRHFIFDGPGMKEKRAQRVRPLTIAEEAAS